MSCLLLASIVLNQRLRDLALRKVPGYDFKSADSTKIEGSENLERLPQFTSPRTRQELQITDRARLLGGTVAPNIGGRPAQLARVDTAVATL